MKRNFTNENFEDFLRQSADGLRLRPSGKVWKNISKHLNKRRRRVGIAIGSFLLAISTFGYFMVQDTAKKFHSIANTNPATTSATKKGFENEITASNEAPKSAILNTPHHASPFSKTNPANTNPLSQLFENNSSETKIKPDVTSNGSETANTAFAPTIVDSFSDQPAEDETKKQGSVENVKPLTYPLTIESVVNSYKTKNHKKARLQFYFTPTISYRKLSENKSFLRSQTATNPNYLPALIFDVNNMVTHKPNIGFELGMAVKYPITPKMKLRGGIQFNVNRYDIRAYNSSTAVTTIMFNGRTSNNRADSLNTYTRYSNTNTGYKTNWLQNYYVQISAPVGVEFKISGNEKTQFGVATTIQPTYVLGDRAYLISTNYKSYAEVPQLVRRWNVNTSLETFVGYSTGRLDWQVGPQVRYQLLSSFINKYPVKENLFDFGLKVGVSLNK